VGQREALSLKILAHAVIERTSSQRPANSNQPAQDAYYRAKMLAQEAEAMGKDLLDHVASMQPTCLTSPRTSTSPRESRSS
jgi:hypothetical protein